MTATSPRFLNVTIAVGVDLGDVRVGRVVVADRRDVAARRRRRSGRSRRPAASSPGRSARASRAGSRAGWPSAGRRVVASRPRRSSRGGIRGSSTRGRAAGRPRGRSAPSGFWRTTLASGSSGLIRRPAASRLRVDVVLVGQVPAEAEAEAALARRRPVAGAHVAAGLAERGDHVVAEAHRRGDVHLRDDDRRLRLDAPLPRHDRRRAVGLRGRPAPWRRRRRSPGRG